MIKGAKDLEVENQEGIGTVEIVNIKRRKNISLEKVDLGVGPQPRKKISIKKAKKKKKA